jgi:hypothetical protein
MGGYRLKLRISKFSLSNGCGMPFVIGTDENLFNEGFIKGLLISTYKMSEPIAFDSISSPS